MRGIEKVVVCAIGFLAAAKGAQFVLNRIRQEDDPGSNPVPPRTLPEKPKQSPKSTENSRGSENGSANGHISTNGSEPSASLPPPLNSNSLDNAFTPSFRSGVTSHIGGRLTFEDAHCVVNDLSEMSPKVIQGAFYGVFDGHDGDAAAKFVEHRLLENVLEDSRFPEEVAGVMHRAFLKTDREFEDACREGREEHSGTTALVALILGRLLTVANAGDCRAVLSRKGKAIALSQDHKPELAAEKARIELAGGIVDDGYVNGFSVARAIGNWHIEGLKVRGANQDSVGPMIADPEVMQTELTADDEFLILGCDGLWDVFTSEEAVRVARNCLSKKYDPQACAEEMLELAKRRVDYYDNCTIIVVCLREEAPPAVQPWRPRSRMNGSAQN